MIKDLANGVVVPVDEQLNTLLEKLESDSELQQILKASSSPEAAITIAREAVFKITAQAIQAQLSGMNASSDQELEKYADELSPAVSDYKQLMIAFIEYAVKTHLEAKSSNA